MSGSVKLNDKDTAGSVVVYDPITPSSLEPFCLSCHDADGATEEADAKSPFSSSNTLGDIPNVAGDKVEGYWNNTYTVHKDNSLTCAGSGDPGTGCHGNGGSINMHGSASRGLLTKNLTLPVPVPVPPDPIYDRYNYELCFDCHDSYPEVSEEVVLGVQAGGNYDEPWAMPVYSPSGIQSLFRDRYISNPAEYPPEWGGPNQRYNNNFDNKPYTPLHNWHLSTDGFMGIAWYYRGPYAENGRASCTTCHNVHGTSGTVRSTYDEFGIKASVTGFPGGYQDLHKTFVPYWNYGDAVLMDYPMSCRWNCHRAAASPDRAAYWHTPSDE